MQHWPQCSAPRACPGHSEGGMAPLRVLELLTGFCNAPKLLELLPRFWRKMWKFIRPFIKSPLKVYLKTENWKKGSATSFFTVKMG